MNDQKKITAFAGGLIWFGAALSIAEIFTGALLAPLGFEKGILAIIIGHFIGCVLMYLCGLIGADTGLGAMRTVGLSFGQNGKLLFALLNILQLVGWTAVMIISGAQAASVITGGSGQGLWCAAIAGLIIVWIMIGLKNLSAVNSIAMATLFVLTIILSVVIFKSGGNQSITDSSLSFGAAVELSAAMPISWLPLISDYTRNASNGKAVTGVSVAVYYVTSCWMYMIGLGAAVYSGESDIAQIMLSAGLGIAGLIIIIFSTVTTTFLDAYSSAVSAAAISEKVKEKPAAIFACIVGMLLAIFTPITQFENFLYLIGSVFAPMAAIQVADYFILKKRHDKEKYYIKNLVIWLAGFIIYRVFLTIATPVGNTLPVMLITIGICVAADKINISKAQTED